LENEVDIALLVGFCHISFEWIRPH